jgi:hypothetical protein
MLAFYQGLQEESVEALRTLITEPLYADGHSRVAIAGLIAIRAE